jgi:hypothetical protein
MTDRFYPLGQASHPDAWKTSYEAANEMRSYERSAYPPGTSIHLPGAREHFGYSTPGPKAERLSKSTLCLTEAVDVPNPREHMTIPRIQEPDDSEIFRRLDVPEMTKSYQSPVARTTFSPMNRSGLSPIQQSLSMSRGKSLPSLNRKQAPPRLRDTNEPIQKLEDEHFSYFVPKHMQRSGMAKLGSQTLTKLKKDDKISFPFTGEGTGFRTQCHGSEWMPEGHKYVSNLPTTSNTTFIRHNMHRISAASLAPHI